MTIKSMISSHVAVQPQTFMPPFNFKPKGVISQRTVQEPKTLIWHWTKCALPTQRGRNDSPGLAPPAAAALLKVKDKCPPWIGTGRSGGISQFLFQLQYSRVRSVIHSLYLAGAYLLSNDCPLYTRQGKLCVVHGLGVSVCTCTCSFPWSLVHRYIHFRSCWKKLADQSLVLTRPLLH